MSKKILYNGEFKDDVILTHTGSSLFNYGNGFFETILYQDKKLFLWKDHIDRLQYTAEIFEFSLCMEWLNQDLVYNLIRKNHPADACLRIKIFCAPVRGEDAWDIIICTNEYERENKDYTVFIHWEHKDSFFCNFKSMNYQSLLYWRHYYTDHFHADEVLFTGINGKVLEASTSNILAVKGQILFYVDIHDNYLAGIMQKNIVYKYKEYGFTDTVAVKGGFSYDFLLNAEEVFLSNSLIIIQRVNRLYIGKKENALFYKDTGRAEKIRCIFLK